MFDIFVFILVFISEMMWYSEIVLLSFDQKTI